MELFTILEGATEGGNSFAFALHVNVGGQVFWNHASSPLSSVSGNYYVFGFVPDPDGSLYLLVNSLHTYYGFFKKCINIQRGKCRTLECECSGYLLNSAVEKPG